MHFDWSNDQLWQSLELDQWHGCHRPIIYNSFKKKKKGDSHMLSLTSSLISATGAPPVVSTSWSLSKDTQAILGTGYKSFTIQITWDPSIAKLDTTSIQAISKTSNGDIFQFDTKSIDGGILRIVGFSSTLQNFANSLTPFFFLNSKRFLLIFSYYF